MITVTLKSYSSAVMLIPTIIVSKHDLAIAWLFWGVVFNWKNQ